MTHATHRILVTYLTHDPLTHCRLCFRSWQCLVDFTCDAGFCNSPLFHAMSTRIRCQVPPNVWHEARHAPFYWQEEFLLSVLFRVCDAQNLKVVPGLDLSTLSISLKMNSRMADDIDQEYIGEPEAPKQFNFAHNIFWFWDRPIAGFSATVYALI